MDESVLKGNTAIFKCHIPSFVSDYVYVTSWLQDGSHEIVAQDNTYGTRDSFPSFLYNQPTTAKQKKT